MKNIVIITAGGNGKRMNNKEKKQFLLLQNRPILFWTIDKFYSHSEIDKIVLVFPADEIEIWKNKILDHYQIDCFSFVIGGNERQDSVYNGLSVCPEDTDCVLIHDGVRPFISVEEISTLLKNSLKFKAIIPVNKVINTIKKLDNNKVVETINRENLVNVLTPQVFNFQMIKHLHEKAFKQKMYFTDDAGICEYYGQEVIAIETGYQNIKITEPFDLIIAETILNSI